MLRVDTCNKTESSLLIVIIKSIETDTYSQILQKFDEIAEKMKN